MQALQPTSRDRKVGDAAGDFALGKFGAPKCPLHHAEVARAVAVQDFRAEDQARRRRGAAQPREALRAAGRRPPE